MLGSTSSAKGVLRRLGIRDRVAIAALIGLPIIIYVPFTIAGHPIIPGDDLTQNYPLRVLSGELLRSGRLPAWDNLIWSGTPLLGGWNAGAMFPGTWLFTFVPAIWAWTINFVAVPMVAGIGMYVLLRWFRCREPAAFLGALAFAYTGFMSGQIVHIGLTQGTAMIPWMILGVDGVSRTSGVKDRLIWVALIGTSFGLAILAGDPRAVSNATIIVAIYLCAIVLRRPSAAVGRIFATLSGLCVGAALAGIQLIPGLSFVGSSQRQTAAYSFFSAGSLSITTIMRDLLVPFLIGGNGNFGLPQYAGNYNIPEVTIGVGFVALTAAFVYVPELVASFLTWLRRAPRIGHNRRALGVWYVLGLAGTLLTMGSSSPLGKLFFHIPFFSGERLQNRNVAILDLALCVLVGFLADDIFKRAANREPNVHDGPTRSTWWSFSAVGPRIFSVVPGLAGIALVCYAFVAPAALWNWATVQSATPAIFRQLEGYLIATGILALAVVAFTLFSPRLSPQFARRAIFILVILDVATYLLNSNFSNNPASSIAPQNPLSSALTRVIGQNGRFALFNPTLNRILSEPQALTQIGYADLNILHNNRSIEGYGSIIDDTYQNVTGTHLLEYINPKRLSGNTYNTLDLRALLALPESFGVVLRPNQAIPVAGGTPVSLPGEASTKITAKPAPDASGPWPLAPAAKVTFVMGEPTTVSGATIVLNSPPPARETLRIQVAGQSRESHPVTGVERQGLTQFTFPVFDRATRIVIKNSSDATVNIGAVVIDAKQPTERVLLDGALQTNLAAPHWNYSGTIGPFIVYTNTETLGLSWLQPAKSKSPTTNLPLPGTVQILSTTANGRERLAASSPNGASLLVRSETYSPGWSATITPQAGGKPKTVNVIRFGLIQAIDLPQGAYVVSFSYAPSHLLFGLVSSFLGFVVLVVLVAAAIFHRRNRTITAGSDDSQL